MRIVAASVLLLALLVAPPLARAKDLCLQAADGRDFVLRNFHLKKGDAAPVSGWTVEFISHPPAPPLLITRTLTGEAITTTEGKHTLMDLTEGGAGFSSSVDGTFGGRGVFPARTFHEIALDAGPSGQIGSDAIGTGVRLQASAGANLNTTPSNSSVSVFPCPKDLGALGLPTAP
jgi:hypothetical protein